MIMPFPLLPFSPFQNSNPCIWCRFLNAIHRIGVCPICGKPLERQASEVDENYDPDANQENPEGAAPAGTKRDIEPDNDMVGPESGGGAQENTYAGDAVLPLAKHHNQNDVVNLDSEPHEIDQKSKLQSKLEEPVGDIWKPDEESPERTETNEQERDENDAKGWAYKPTPRWLLVVTGGFIVAIIGVALFLTGVIDFSKPVDSAESDTENESDMVEALVGQIDEITEEIPPVDPASFIIPRETPSITESPEKTDSVPSPKQTQTAEPIQKPSGPRMYTSFAYMVSLDQATGVAEFDYFDMLKGADAVSWLVEMEGYSESAAEKIVAGYRPLLPLLPSVGKEKRLTALHESHDEGLCVTPQNDPLSLTHPKDNRQRPLIQASRVPGSRGG